MQKVYVVTWSDPLEWSYNEHIRKIFSKREYAEHYLNIIGDDGSYTIREFVLSDDEYKDFIPTDISYRYEIGIECKKENCDKTLGDCELFDLHISKGYRKPCSIYPDGDDAYWLTFCSDKEFTTKEDAINTIRDALKELGYECKEIEVHNWICK